MRQPDDAHLLLQQVLMPLVVGGRVHPLHPLGAKRSRRLAELAPAVGYELAELDAHRIRHARRLCPIDAIDPLDPVEWLMTAAINDLLQSTNRRLYWALGGRRRQTLLAQVLALLDSLPAPTTLRQVLCRHATFARLMELQRLDTTVIWWTGKARFEGCAPPSRLLRWSRLRRVRRTAAPTGLPNMAQNTGLLDGEYLTALRALLRLSPLTDLATAGRERPQFEWNQQTLGLLSFDAGRTLAMRALRSRDVRAAASAIRHATETASSAIGPELRALAQDVAEQLAVLASQDG